MAERARAETGPRHYRGRFRISIENLSRRLPVPATGDEIARLTEVLNSMLERLEAAVSTLSQFVADASHELRTPLAVIRTTAELALRRARSPEAYRDSLQEIAVEAERMTKLVEDLLLLARRDTGAAEMPLTAMDVREVVARRLLGNARTRRIAAGSAWRRRWASQAAGLPGIVRPCTGCFWCCWTTR